MLHVLPHPAYDVEDIDPQDGLVWSALGYPCHPSITSNTTQAELGKQLQKHKQTIKVQKEMQKEAVEKEDFQLAKTRQAKVNATIAKAKQLQKTLKTLNEAVLKSKDMCLPPPPQGLLALFEADWVRWQFWHTRASWEVREWYTEHLETVAAGVQAFRKSGKQETSCDVAGVAVRLRSQIKLDARLRGSAVLHFGYILRDRYVYGSNVDVFERKRESLEKKGESTTEEKVCEAVLDSSFRANTQVTSVAEYLSTYRNVIPNPYAIETLLCYIAVAVPIFVIVKLLQPVLAKVLTGSAQSSNPAGLVVRIFKNIFVMYPVVTLLHIIFMLSQNHREALPNVVSAWPSIAADVRSIVYLWNLKVFCIHSGLSHLLVGDAIQQEQGLTPDDGSRMFQQESAVLSVCCGLVAIFGDQAAGSTRMAKGVGLWIVMCNIRHAIKRESARKWLPGCLIGLCLLAAAFEHQPDMSLPASVAQHFEALQARMR
jgi:hypothetical protein